MNKLLAILAFLTLMTSCLSPPEADGPSSSGANAPFNPASTPTRWSNSSLSAPLPLRISQDFVFNPGDNDVDGRNQFEQMMIEWNLSTSVHNFFQIPATVVANKNSTNLSDFNDGEMGIYQSQNWFSNVSSSALAITQFFGFRRNVGTPAEFIELVHADIIVNERDFTFSFDPASTTTFDLSSVILHELGHFIGLDHQNDFAIPSVMQPTLSRSDTNRDIETNDISAVRSLYQVSSLIAAQGATRSAIAQVPHKNEGELVRGVIELRENGDCHHYENDKLVSTH